MITYKESQAAKYLFREYWNDYLSVSTFALDKGMTEEEAIQVIELGRETHNKEAEYIKKLNS